MTQYVYKAQYHMESALYGIYALVVFVSEISHSFAALTRSISDTRQQLVRKYR